MMLRMGMMEKGIGLVLMIDWFLYAYEFKA